MIRMYIASVPNRNSPPAILLRESFRDQGKVKTRTLANLTSWAPTRIEALRQVLRGDFDQLPPGEPILGPIFGLLFVLKQIADQLGLTAAIGHSRLGKLALFLILARVAHQGSRLSASRWAQDHAVSEVVGLASFDEDDLYAALDDLCARQEKIERALYHQYQRRSGKQPPRLFLYDVTSSYLEGERNELGAFGYNRTRPVRCARPPDSCWLRRRETSAAVVSRSGVDTGDRGPARSFLDGHIDHRARRRDRLHRMKLGLLLR